MGKAPFAKCLLSILERKAGVFKRLRFKECVFEKFPSRHCRNKAPFLSVDWKFLNRFRRSSVRIRPSIILRTSLSPRKQSVHGENTSFIEHIDVTGLFVRPCYLKGWIITEPWGRKQSARSHRRRVAPCWQLIRCKQLRRQWAEKKIYPHSSHIFFSTPG